MRPVLAALAALVALIAAAPAQAAWAPPVDGEVARRFDLGVDPFERGRHRGADFAAPAGVPVRAVCGGRVVFAGSAGRNGRVVTVRCGRWRATHLPLATVAVAARARVAAGDVVGTVAASRAHTGVHVGVRRAGDAFGYVNPMRFIGRTPRMPDVPPLVTRRGPRPVSVQAVASAHAFGPVHHDAPARHGVSVRRGVPAAVWGGVAAVLVGLVGGLGWRPRHRRARRVVPREEVRSVV